MNERAAGRLAWGLFGLAMALAAGAVVFLILGWSTERPAGAFGFRGFGIVFALVFSATGWWSPRGVPPTRSGAFAEGSFLT